MAAPFQRTVRSLAEDGPRRARWMLGVSAVLLVAWGSWFLRASVPVYEMSDSARVEAEIGALPLEAARGGRVVELLVTIGQRVEKGQALVVLDASREELELEEARARLDAFDGQLDPLRSERVATEQALSDSRQAAAGAVDESRAKARAERAAAELAKAEEERNKQLVKHGIASQVEASRARAEAEARRSVLESALHATRRLHWERKTEQSGTQSRIGSIGTEIARVEGQAKIERATIKRLQNEIAQRTVRAPVSGIVGELPETLRIGAVLAEGERVVSLIPDAKLVAVAEYPAQAAVGRIRSGQPARIRLHGFPWTTHGMVQAEVARVESEAREGKVRVELAVKAPERSSIRLEHGQPGSAEIEVERVSPAVLVLRTAGLLLTP